MESPSRMTRSSSPRRQLQLRWIKVSPSTCNLRSALSSHSPPSLRTAASLGRVAEGEPTLAGAGHAAVETRPGEEAVHAPEAVGGQLAGGPRQVAVGKGAPPFQVGQQRIRIP